MKTEMIPLGELNPYPDNPRIITDEAVAAVANSIRDFGQLQPLVVDRDNVLVAGHTRLRALESLKIEKAWCVRATDLTPEQVRAFRLADNRTGEKTDWDMEALAAEVKDLGLVPGFTEQEMQELQGLTFEDPTAGTEAGEEDKKAKKKLKVTITCPKCGHEFQ